MVARIYEPTYSINVSCSKLGYKPDLKHQSRRLNLIDGFNSPDARKDLKIWQAFRGQTYRRVHNLPIDRSNTSDATFARSFARFNAYNDFLRHTISVAGLTDSVTLRTNFILQRGTRVIFDNVKLELSLNSRKGQGEGKRQPNSIIFQLDHLRAP